MLTYDMDARGDDTRYGYLYRCIKDDIVCSRIVAGSRLPPKRKLAEHLGVGVVTVESAYRQLVAEGYVEARERSGFYAIDLGGSVELGRAFPRDVADAQRSMRQSSTSPIGVCVSKNPKGHTVDMTGAHVASGIFPYVQWARTLRTVLTDESEESLVEATGPAGCLRLREAIAAYLRGFRGMDVSASQIVIGAGAQVLYGLIVQLLGRNAGYAIENPGYPRLAKIYQGNDVALDYLKMDDAGVSVSELEESCASVLHIMPAHQFPTGRVYPVSRRYELLAWASERPDRWIVEDDFDCEFRLAGRPIPSLQSIDAQGCVIYTNTFTKSLGPAYRLGYMVLPPALAKRFHEELGFYSCTVGTLDQLTLARFIESGEYERHVSKLRTHYRRTRDALFEALRTSGLPALEDFAIDGADAGLHFVISFKDRRNEAELVALAEAEGVALNPMSGYYLPEGVAPERAVSEGVVPEGVAGLSGSERRGAPVRRFVAVFGGIQPSAASAAVAALERAWL